MQQNALVAACRRQEVVPEHAPVESLWVQMSSLKCKEPGDKDKIA